MEPKFHYRVHKSLPSVLYLRHVYPVYTAPPKGLNSYFNFIISYVPKTSLFYDSVCFITSVNSSDNSVIPALMYKFCPVQHSQRTMKWES
jgi:hypothetical protein